MVSLLWDTGSGGDAEGDELNSIENLSGSGYDDSLFGDNNANFLNGNDGDDTLLGFGGDDILYGDGRSLGGNDVLNGGAGHDTLNGGPGGDTMAGELDADTLRLAFHQRGCRAHERGRGLCQPGRDPGLQCGGG